MTIPLQFVFNRLNRTATLLCFLALSLAAFLLGQAPTEQAVTPAEELAQLRRVIESQREQIQSQRQQLDRQQAQLEAIDRRLQLMARSAVLPAPPGPAENQQVAAKAAAPIASTPAPATTAAVPLASAGLATPKRWFEKYSIRGYTQLRTNRIFADNPLFACEQCDRSMGGNNNLLVRRARFVLFGDINDRISIYFQPDFASPSGTLHFGQIRDLYFDVHLDKKKEYRFRFGQSKIPFGFENLQTSQNRLALDRNDPLNSALPNERDLGALFYWAPAHIRKRFAYLASSGLKGSGDYGVFGAGVYNGQSANKAEANNNMHAVTRLSYPFELKNKQIIEAGIQAYTGRYTVTADQRTATTRGPGTFADRRAAASFILYPQPFGLQGEYNFGLGPRYNPRANTIEPYHLKGGYLQAMYMRRFRGQALTPYARFQYFDGGKKVETDARLYLVKSFETGLEWQLNPFMEWTAEFVHGNRTFEDGRLPVNRQMGNLLRLQLQLNY